MPTTVTQATTSSVATHHIDWAGLAGAIFWLVLASLVLFVIGFATPGWSVTNKMHTGLWEACTCGQGTSDESKFCILFFEHTALLLHIMSVRYISLLSFT